MDAIILAGGKGTRLRSLVSDRPKPMAEVCGKPFLFYILNEIIKNKIDKIIISVGYKKDSIINYFGDSFKGVPIVYSIEDSPLLTGGAIKKALCCVDGSDFFVLNGDSFTSIPFIDLINLKKQKSTSLVIAANFVSNSNRYGLIDFNKQCRIISFREKSPVSIEGYINSGIYLMDKNIFLNYGNSVFSFENDFLPSYVKSNPSFVHLSHDFFIDIGVPSDYLLAQRIFRERSH